MSEFIQEAKFPDGIDVGPAYEVIGEIVGGAAGDWITQKLGIPAMEPELGTHNDYFFNFLPKSPASAYGVVK